MRSFALQCFLALALHLTVCTATDACDGGDGVIALTASPRRKEYRYGVQATFGPELPQQQPERTSVLVAEPADGCLLRLFGSDKYKGSYLLASRGNCTFLQKALQAEKAGAAALLISNTESGCLVLGTNTTATGPRDVTVPVLSVSTETGQQLRDAAASGRKISCWAPTKPPLDPAAGLIWLLAVSTVVLAGLWAGHDYTSGRQHLQDGNLVRGRRSPSHQTEDSVEVQMVSGTGAVAFVAIASVMLVLLFFFLNHVFALVLIILFSIASFQAMTVVFAAGLGAGFPHLRHRKLNVGLGLGSLSYTNLLAMGPAAAWIAAWFLFAPETLGWFFQNGMGISLMLLVLRQFMLPDLKVASLLLPLCFLYDIFWVFIQPLLTRGPSVMVEVAMGGSSHESMPMLLQVPSLWGPPYSTSILGYGDIVLPGLLIVFARIWDCSLQKPTSAAYFWPLTAGYGVGLILTFAALVLRIGGGQGQPALLYLIPCTLGLCAVLAWQRGELRSMWRGMDAELKRTRSSSSSSDLETVSDADGAGREELLDPQRSS